MKLSEPINNTATNATAVNKHSVCSELIVQFTDLPRQAHCIQTPEKLRRVSSSISTFSDVDN